MSPGSGQESASNAQCPPIQAERPVSPPPIGSRLAQLAAVPLDQVHNLTDMYRALLLDVIDVHAQVGMDTPEDQDLHDRAVHQFREAVATLDRVRNRAHTRSDR